MGGRIIGFMTGNQNHRQHRDLAVRFTALLERMGLGPHSGGTHRLLDERYSEPGRHYHNLNHVGYCLGQLDGVREQLHDADAAELALWFHDAVYETGADDNELRSALLFDRHLGIHLPSGRADRIHARIMATVHPSGAVERDAQFVADIDLSGLALSREAFRRDTEDLRRERHHLTDSQFELGTVGFFRKLMAGPSIFLTDHFRANYEQPALRNIVELINEMEAGSTGKTATRSTPRSHHFSTD